MSSNPFRFPFYWISGLSLLSLVIFAIASQVTQTTVPTPAIDSSAATGQGKQTAVFAGACFWGIEAVFEHVKGFSDVVSGFSGGHELPIFHD